jgi:hypothetical protein
MVSSDSIRYADDKTIPNVAVLFSDISDEEVRIDKSRAAGTTSSFEQDVEIDTAIEARITKKFDQHIVPWLFGLWLLACIDRSNIGNARIDGLSADLNLGTGPQVQHRSGHILCFLYLRGCSEQLAHQACGCWLLPSGACHRLGGH